MDVTWMLSLEVNTYSQSADEDCVMWSKAPVELLHGSWGEIVLSADVSRVKNEMFNE